MKKGQLRQLVLSLGGGIAVFLVLALGLRWNFLFSAALGVGIYLGLWFLLAPKADPITLYFAQRPDGGEMQALMEEAERDLKAIRSAVGRITDVRTHEDALALTETGDRLYRYLREHPEKIPSANRFLTYYLDTVGRILGQYVKFQEAGLGTSEVGRGAGDFRGAGVPAEGAGHPAQAENWIRGTAQPADGLGAV